MMEASKPIPEYIIFEKKKELSKANQYRIFIVPAYKCIIQGTGLVEYELVKTSERHMEMSVEQVEPVEREVSLAINVDGVEHQVTRFLVVASIFDAITKFKQWSAEVMNETDIGQGK